MSGNSARPGACLTDGPFANMKVNMGPGQNLNAANQGAYPQGQQGFNDFPNQGYDTVRPSSFINTIRAVY